MFRGRDAVGGVYTIELFVLHYLGACAKMYLIASCSFIPMLRLLKNLQKTAFQRYISCGKIGGPDSDRDLFAMCAFSSHSA